MSRVLLSAVGTADPMTYSGDGPILHIARHYHPDKVILLATPNFVNRAESVAQVLRLLNGESQVTIEVIDLPPHEYLWIKPVRAALQKAWEDNPDQELLVNVSSGTPAISSALVALHAFGFPPTTAIQVWAPHGRADREQDSDILDGWELNPDNEPNQPNRCITVPSDQLAVLLQRENIKKHIAATDFRAALRLVDSALLPIALVKGISSWDRRTSMNNPVEAPSKKTELAIMALQAALIREDYRGFLLLAEVAIDSLVRQRLGERNILKEVEEGSRRIPGEDYVSLGALLRNSMVTNIFGVEVVDAFLKFKKARNLAVHDVKPLSPKVQQDSKELLLLLEKLSGVSANLVQAGIDELLLQIDNAPFE